MGSGVSSFRTDQKPALSEKLQPQADAKTVDGLQNLASTVSDDKAILSSTKNVHAMRADTDNKMTTASDSENRNIQQSNSYYDELDNDESQDDNGESATFFAHTALSLGMDNDDLLFNLMYFEDGYVPTLGSMMNSVQQETLALHSSNNTPYKLKPASENAIAGLKSEIFLDSEADASVEKECAVCKDEMENGCSIVRLPACSHYFHEDCLLRWINLQGWCPVCRADILAVSAVPNECVCFDCEGESCERSVALAVVGVAAEMDVDAGVFLPKQLFSDVDEDMDEDQDGTRTVESGSERGTSRLREKSLTSEG